MDLSPPSVDVAHSGSQLASGWAELDSASAACPPPSQRGGECETLYMLVKPSEPNPRRRTGSFSFILVC